MSDKDLINRISEEWIRNGGDSVGFEFRWYKVLERIREMEKEKC